MQPSHRPLADEFALELGQGTKDMEDEPPSRGGGVEALLQTFEPYSPCVQRGDGVDEVP
jgi:hypothetical protein